MMAKRLLIVDELSTIGLIVRLCLERTAVGIEDRDAGARWEHEIGAASIQGMK
jgi:hypothetical protein